MPFLVISPFAPQSSVSSALIDQSSVVKFIEYNWRLPALGNGAADQAAGSLDSLFNFQQRPDPSLFLDSQTGEPVSHKRS